MNSDYNKDIEKGIQFSLRKFQEIVESEYPSSNCNESQDRFSMEMSFDKAKSKNTFNNLIKHKQILLNKPFTLNVMVLGQTQLGKSSFVDAFLDKSFQINSIRPSTNSIREVSGSRIEGTVSFSIKMIDTPGYENKGNLETWLKMVKKFLISKMIEYQQLQKTMQANPQIYQKYHQSIEDNRVHLILYFFSSPRIQETDIFILKKLQKFCSIIPILAKGDCFTCEEIINIKEEFRKQIKENKIKLFDCNISLRDYPDKINELANGSLGMCPPFLLVTSVKKVKVKNQIVYGREYNWGICNIENKDHCDFVLLQKLIIGFFSVDLIYFAEYYYMKIMDNLAKKKPKQSWLSRILGKSN